MAARLPKALGQDCLKLQMETKTTAVACILSCPTIGAGYHIVDNLVDT
jgi:hypothetical protein